MRITATASFAEVKGLISSNAPQPWEGEIHGSGHIFFLNFTSRVYKLYLRSSAPAVWEQYRLDRQGKLDTNSTARLCIFNLRRQLNCVIVPCPDMFISGWLISHGDLAAKLNRSRCVFIDNIVRFCMGSVFCSSSNNTGALQESVGFPGKCLQPLKHESKQPL